MQKNHNSWGGNFPDFHFIHIAINFKIILRFSGGGKPNIYVCIYVSKENKPVLYENLYNSIHFYAVYLKINFGLGLRDSKHCQDLRAT